MKKFNYENRQYLEKLDQLEESYYSKYILFIKRYLKNKEAKFLDVGCGNGKVLRLLSSDGYKNGYGVDVSKLFIKDALANGVKNAKVYNGTNLPYDDGYFYLIGSFNVLEHTENPEQFLVSQIEKLKKGGYLIVACPNFLTAVFNSPHPRLIGIKNKSKNAGRVIIKLLNINSSFKKMPPIHRKKFEYDDDAIVVTNLIDIKNVLSKNNCKIVYESGFINYNNFFVKLINIVPIIRYSMPSCFVVAQKMK